MIFFVVLCIFLLKTSRWGPLVPLAPPELPARRGPRALPALWVPPVPEALPAQQELRVLPEPLAQQAQPAR